jgi:hypothetical protein
MKELSMIPDEDSQDWQALWKAQKGEVTAMKSEVVCTRARALERKMKIELWGVPLLLTLVAAKAAFSFVQFHEPWIRAGWAWGVVTCIYAAARWAQFGMPGPLHHAAGSENCADFLRAELNKKRKRILELRWILLLIFPGFAASWWGGGPVAVAKGLGIEWPALFHFQESPAPLIGFALLLAFIWVKFGSEASAIQSEMEALSR